MAVLYASLAGALVPLLLLKSFQNLRPETSDEIEEREFIKQHQRQHDLSQIEWNSIFRDQSDGQSGGVKVFRIRRRMFQNLNLGRDGKIHRRETLYRQDGELNGRYRGACKKIFEIHAGLDKKKMELPEFYPLLVSQCFCKI